MQQALKWLSSTLILSLLIFTSCFNSDPEEELKEWKTSDGTDKYYDSLSGKTVTEAELDSLFEVLVTRVEALAEEMDTADHASDIYAHNFDDLAEEFGAITKIDSTSMKANVGYVIARICALNHNSALQKMADSLDAYYWQWDAYWETEEDIVDWRNKKRSKPFAKAYNRNGINGLSAAMFARQADMIRQNSAIPSFPRFITMNYIQNLIETEIMPALNGVVDALERIEDGPSDQYLLFTVDGEEVEMDMAEIYIANGAVRLLRHCLSFLTAYNMDVESPSGGDIHEVVNKLVELEESEDWDYSYYVEYSLSGDTLIEKSVYERSAADEKFDTYVYDVLKHNLERSDFLAIARKNHNRMYEDIKAVPVKMKKAIAALEAETDDQENDIIPVSDLWDLDDEMLDIAADIEAEGFSVAFANNFSTPEKLADFITELLTTEYQFNETIDGVTIDFALNLSAFYTNPEEDLKQWFPLYKFNGKDNMVIEDVSDYGYTYTLYNNSFTLSSYADSVVVNIDDSKIDSIAEDSWGDKVVYLNVDANYAKEVESDFDFFPISLVDDKGNKIVENWDELEDAIIGTGVFPYFKDYTFNGIFPGMDRDKMKELYEDLDSLL